MGTCPIRVEKLRPSRAPGATLLDMPEHTLKLLDGGDAAHQMDLTHLLEDMDLRDAMPKLREISRRRKPAANSVHAVVRGGLQEAVAPAGHPSCSPE